MKQLSVPSILFTFLLFAYTHAYAKSNDVEQVTKPHTLSVHEAKFEKALALKDFHLAGKLLSKLSHTDGYPIERQYQLTLTFFERVLSLKDLDDLPAFKAQVLALLNHLPASQQAELNLKMAELLLYQGRFDLGIDRAKVGINQLVDSPSATYADLHYFLGANIGRQGRNDLALENILKAIEIRESNSLPPNLRYYLGLMAIYSQSGNNKSALEYGKKALTLAGTDHPILHLIHLNLSAAYADLKDYETTIYHSKKSIEIAQSKGIENNLPYVNIGNSYVELGEYEKAIEIMSKASHLFTANKQTQWLPSVKTIIGQAYVGLGERQLAQQYFMQAYSDFAHNNMLTHKLSFYPEVIENLVALENYQHAYEMLNEFKKLSDKARDIETKKYIEELKTSHELKFKEEQIALLEDEKELQGQILSTIKAKQAAEQKVNLYIQILSGALLVLVVILALVIRNRVVSNRELEKKNKSIKQLNDNLKKLSIADNLTGLFNRHYLTDFIHTTQLRRRASDQQERNKWSILLLDIDHFKQFNDTYGHGAGDSALVHFSNTLKSVKRESDILIRWGGEEFIWLCADSDVSKAQLAFTRLQETLAQKPVVTENNHEVYITASSGAHSFINSELTPDMWLKLLTQVDQALYESKQQGRNRCTIYNQAQEECHLRAS